MLLQVCRALPGQLFVFAGKGSLAGEIEGLPNALNAGFVQGEELTTLIRNAQFCINPSECQETYGLTNAEALILGTPVVASRIGAFPEIIRDYVNGRLFEAGNAEALTDILKEILAEPEERNRLAKNGATTPFLSCESYVRALETYYGMDRGASLGGTKDT